MLTSERIEHFSGKALKCLMLWPSNKSCPGMIVWFSPTMKSAFFLRGCKTGPDNLLAFLHPVENELWGLFQCRVLIKRVKSDPIRSVQPLPSETVGCQQRDKTLPATALIVPSSAFSSFLTFSIARIDSGMPGRKLGGEAHCLRWKKKGSVLAPLPLRLLGRTEIQKKIRWAELKISIDHWPNARAFVKGLVNLLNRPTTVADML